jgi:cysteine desulfurase/selenocysteine lyase
LDVIKLMEEYYREFPACSGIRSDHWFAREVNERMEGNPGKGILGPRRIIADFINAASEKEIVFTQNTTHAINLVALGFPFRRGDTVLLTDLEHNSNLLPWLKLQKKGRIKVDFIEPDEGGEFDLNAYENKMKSTRVRLVSMVYTSNATGRTIPADKIIDIAHRHGALVLLDGAQTVPHQRVDVQSLGVDFLAFSMHKMCGPKGVGVLYGKKDLLGKSPHEEKEDGENTLAPAVLGGGTVANSTYQSYTLMRPPGRFEAGVQNYPGQIASGAAVTYLQQIGLEQIKKHEIALNSFLTEEMLKRYGDTGWFRILGPEDASRRGGILTFEVKRPNAPGIAAELSKRNNIMLRDSVFCVHSYFNKIFGPQWSRPLAHDEHRMINRVSLYFYNTIGECQIFLETLDEVFKERCYI